MSATIIFEIVSGDDNLNIRPEIRSRWPDLEKDTSSICFTIFKTTIEGELTEEDRQLLDGHDFVLGYDTWKRPSVVRTEDGIVEV